VKDEMLKTTTKPTTMIGGQVCDERIDQEIKITFW